MIPCAPKINLRSSTWSSILESFPGRVQLSRNQDSPWYYRDCNSSSSQPFPRFHPHHGYQTQVFSPTNFFNYFNVPRLFYFILGTMLWSSKLKESEKTPKHIFKTHTREAFIFLNILQDSPAPIIGKNWASSTFLKCAIIKLRIS